MTKRLTVEEIETRVTKSLQHARRMVEQGTWSENDRAKFLGDLARWSTHHYARLPQVQAFDTITKLFGRTRNG